MLLPLMDIKSKLRHPLIWIGHFIYRCDPRVTVMIGVTYFCQCDCPHCAMANYPKNKKEELSAEELMEIINRFSKSKIKGVYFFGGEPLLRNDIFELISCARRKWFVPCLDTNGLLLNQEMARKLKKAGLWKIGVSIDSSRPQIHDKLRGIEGSFERAIRGIQNCLNEKIRCYLSTYATKEDLRNGDLEKIILLGEKLGVDYVRILPPLALGRWSGGKDIQLDSREEQLLNKICRHSLGLREDRQGRRCPAMSKKLFYISPYGGVQPCPYLPLNFGNLREEPLENIFKRMWHHPMFEIKIGGCPINDEEFQEKYLSKIAPLTKLPMDLSDYEN